MTQRSGFFNAQQNSGNYDRVYLASDFADYFASFIGNGVFAEHSEQLQVMPQDSPDMSVQVLAGQAWINGYWYENTVPLTLNVDVADGTLDRVDIVVVRYDSTTRDISTVVKKGTPSAGATAPALSRTEDLYELKLAEIDVSHGTVNINTSKITDTRSNSEVCGWVTGVINQMDTTTLFNQLQAATQDAVDAMNEALNGTTEGELKTYRKSLRVETEIPASSDLNTYQTAGNYGCSVAGNVSGITNKPSGLTNVFLLFVHVIGSAVLQEVIDAVDGSRWCRAGTGSWVQTYDSKSVVPVANGGTGATTASAARDNIKAAGIESAADAVLIGQQASSEQGCRIIVNGEQGNRTVFFNESGAIGYYDNDRRTTIWAYKLEDLWRYSYPVGSVYISYNSTSPASLFGGSWMQIVGYFPYFTNNTKPGGSNTHTLAVSQMPSHTHTPYTNYDMGGVGFWASNANGGSGWKVLTRESTGADYGLFNKNTGGGGSHNNMPQYQGMYAWRRTA